MARKGGKSHKQESKDKNKEGNRSASRQKARSGPKQRVTIVHPKDDSSFTNSLQVRRHLEKNISLRKIGVTLVASRPVRNKRVLLVTQTLEMKGKLNEALRSCPEVEQKVTISDPKGRDPHIIVHNFEKCEADRERQETKILKRIRKSNALPDGEMRVKFRLRGRVPIMYKSLYSRQDASNASDLDTLRQCAKVRSSDVPDARVVTQRRTVSVTHPSV
ncbi:hypothetical protein HNY73_002317 [Argiope bruennichi]|uniref:Uncharacterized protein n=1 Tax=Argiope bruennichi TaxID=94029 RepID=A0A8T0FU74_ARGBR|nr:hypothetical protein HNY73_002317 [Argiope bruennichi]